MTLQEESFGGEFGGEESGGVEVGGEVRAMSTMMMAFFHYPAFVGVIDERFELGSYNQCTRYTTCTLFGSKICGKLAADRCYQLYSQGIHGNGIQRWEYIEKVNAQKKSKKYFLKFF